jgi:hypothetical protein
MICRAPKRSKEEGMTMLSWILPLLLAASAPPSGLTVEPGHSIIFRVENGHPVTVREGEAPEPGELSAKLSIEGGNTLLHMTNNTAQWLNYRATMTQRNGHRVHTSVCTLLSNNRGGFEFWQEPLKSVTIDDFTPAPEDRMTCR